MEILKENLHNFSNFPKNVIKDLFKCERGERGGGGVGGQNSLLSNI